MKVTIPNNYTEYINIDVYVLLKTLNSLIVLNSADKEILDRNLRKQKPSSERFSMVMMSNIVKLHTTDGILDLPDKLLASGDVSFKKDNLGILIIKNK